MRRESPSGIAGLLGMALLLSLAAACGNDVALGPDQSPDGAAKGYYVSGQGDNGAGGSTPAARPSGR
jgi:hypothetical protein